MGDIFKNPENVRLVGEIPKQQEIYIEDYVITFLSQSKQHYDEAKFDLFGMVKREEEKDIYIVRGAVLLEKDILGDYFDKETYLGQAIYSKEINDKWNDVEKRAKRHLPENSKIFIIEGINDNRMWALDEKKWVEQTGYYIFYARNDAMQQYMIEANSFMVKEPIEQVADQVTKKMRTILNEHRDESHQKKIMACLYCICVLLVNIILVIGITTINNYDKMKALQTAMVEMEKTLDEKSEVKMALDNQDDAMDIKEASNFTENVTDTEKSENQKEIIADSSDLISAEAGTKTEEKITADAEIKTEEKITADAETKTEEKITADAETVAVVPETNIPESYMVQKGDTLLSISRQFYGNTDMVTKLCELNQIEDGDKIRYGQKILLPK